MFSHSKSCKGHREDTRKYMLIRGLYRIEHNMMVNSSLSMIKTVAVYKIKILIDYIHSIRSDTPYRSRESHVSIT